MDLPNQYFTHQMQIDFIDSLRNTDISLLEKKMLDAVLQSLHDSKSRVRENGGNVTVTMSHERYQKYINIVVSPEQNMPLDLFIVHFAQHLKVRTSIFEEKFLAKAKETLAQR